MVDKMSKNLLRARINAFAEIECQLRARLHGMAISCCFMETVSQLLQLLAMDRLFDSNTHVELTPELNWTDMRVVSVRGFECEEGTPALFFHIYYYLSRQWALKQVQQIYYIIRNATYRYWIYVTVDVHVIIKWIWFTQHNFFIREESI